MPDIPTDDQRLQATEAQVRRALGLDRQPSASPERQPPVPANCIHRGPRRFVRDGEVPVTVIHHDDAGGTNKLDESRQALREQIAAREHAERSLEEARAAILTLETQLAHERIAKDEALSRIEGQRQQVERQLEEERQARRQTGQERDAAIAGRMEAEARLREIMAAQEAHKSAGAVVEGRPSKKVGKGQVKPSAGSVAAQEPRRRGRPPKIKEEPEAEFVEWWKPGWKERFR